MISKLVMRNWRSHKESVFEFSEGTNVLIGIMGSGKSSVMDAIAFGMFGTFPALQQRKLKIEDVVSRGEASASVEIEFILDGKQYKVRRLVEKGRTSTSELYSDGVLLESPQSSKVTEAVEGIIKMDYDLFIRAIYAEQNAIDYFLTIPRGQRMKKIDALLRLDKFESARAASLALMKRISDEKKTKMVLLERMSADDSLGSYESLRKDVKALKERLDEYGKQSRMLANEVDGIKREISNAEEMERKKLGLERSLITISASMDELTKRMGEIESSLEGDFIISPTLEEDLKTAEANAFAFAEDIQKLRTDISTSRARLDMQKAMERELAGKLADKESVDRDVKLLGDLEELKLAIVSKSKELDNAKRILFSSRSEIEHQRSHIENLGTSSCPVCEREIGEELYSSIRQSKEKRMGELEAAVESAERSIAGLSDEIEVLNSKRSRLELLVQKQALLIEEEKKYERIKGALQELSMKIHEDERKLESAQADYRTAAESYEDLKSKAEKVRMFNSKKREMESIRERIEALNTERRRMGKSIDEIAFDAETLSVLRKRLEKTLSQKVSAETLLASEKRILLEKEERMKSIESQREMIDSLREEIETLEKKHAEVKTFSESLESVQSRLRKEFVQSVNMVMSEIWRQFYPYADYRDIRLSVEEGDYVLEILSKDWVGVEGTASGGERSSAALVLRIALALVLAPNLRWLILDEPTHNLDANAIEQLAAILRHKIGEFVDQVFLITHEARLEDAVSGYLYRLDRPDSKSQPTVVQKIDIMAT